MTWCHFVLITLLAISGGLAFYSSVYWPLRVLFHLSSILWFPPSPVDWQDFENISCLPSFVICMSRNFFQLWLAFKLYFIIWKFQTSMLFAILIFFFFSLWLVFVSYFENCFPTQRSYIQLLTHFHKCFNVLFLTLVLIYFGVISTNGLREVSNSVFLHQGPRLSQIHLWTCTSPQWTPLSHIKDGIYVGLFTGPLLYCSLCPSANISMS